MPEKPIIGILGGVCAGKSTVARQLAELGCGVIDADVIVHQMLDEASVRKKIVESFSQSILDSEGKIDHKKMADIVFTNPEKLSLLNKIIHPVVLERVRELIKQLKSQNQVRAIVMDMPLLLEVDWAKKCDKLIFVNCKRQLRVERAQKGGLLSENQLKFRENFQISLDKKEKIADYIIVNNSDILVLTRQVANVFSRITTDL